MRGGKRRSFPIGSAALAWTEAHECLANTRAGRSIRLIEKKFSEKEILDLTLAVAMINLWNRVAISLRSVPGHYRAARQSPGPQHLDVCATPALGPRLRTSMDGLLTWPAVLKLFFGTDGKNIPASYPPQVEISLNRFIARGNHAPWDRPLILSWIFAARLYRISAKYDGPGTNRCAGGGQSCCPGTSRSAGAAPIFAPGRNLHPACPARQGVGRSARRRPLLSGAR